MITPGLKKFSTGLALALILAWGLLGVAAAEIYMYVDENGVRHFSNVPTSSRYEFAAPEIDGYSPARNGAERFDAYIKDAANRYGLEFALVKAIVQVESNFDPAAVSTAGAVGLMQIMPANFTEFRLRDPYEPRANIMAGARYFKSLLNRFNNDLRLSLAAYNAGPGAVARFNGVPPYPETRNYINRVMGQYTRYKRMYN